MQKIDRQNCLLAV